MRVVSMVAVCLVMSFAGRVSAQTSCAATANLCTGNPCVTSNVTVESTCVLDFGASDLVIGGALTVPAGGTLQFMAKSIQVQGRIKGPGASVTLIATAGDAGLNTEIDVETGSLTVDATGSIDVKSRLKAKPGGSVTLAAGGTIETRSTAVIEVQDAGVVTLSGDGGVTLGGNVFANSGTVQIDSSAGIATINQTVHVDGDTPGSVTVNGAAGVVVNTGIIATRAEPGSVVTLASSAGDVTLMGKISVAGVNAGSIIVQAPAGTVGPLGFNAKGKTSGGSVSITAATVALTGNIVAKASVGNGGSIQLKGSTAVTLDGTALDVSGKANGGTVGILGDAGSGDIMLDAVAIRAAGSTGDGGNVTVSAPAGTVNMRAKVTATTNFGTGGTITVGGMGLTVGPKAIFDADSHGPSGGEIRFAQSGAGPFTLSGTCEARDNGIIEALAPTGSLTMTGKFRAGPAGCVGASAGVTLDVSNAVADVPVTPSCP